jgi:quinol monooxygenase YgiN
MAVEIGILALLEAKPGKGPDLHALLKSARGLAAAEEGTVTWYAFQVSDTTYGIFDTFDSEESRIAHTNGEIPKALAQVGGELLAKEPDIQTIDIVAVK